MKRNSVVLSGLIIIMCVGMSFAQKGFLKIGDIKGESTERAHKDWIIIESISQGLEQLPQVMTGSSRRRGTVTFNDLVITKPLDKATPKLMEMCAKGQVVPELELDIVASNGKIFYKITLNTVKINSINTNSDCDPDCILVDEVSISYSKITWEYSDITGNKTVATYNAETGN